MKKSIFFIIILFFLPFNKILCQNLDSKTIQKKIRAINLWKTGKYNKKFKACLLMSDAARLGDEKAKIWLVERTAFYSPAKIWLEDVVNIGHNWAIPEYLQFLPKAEAFYFLIDLYLKDKEFKNSIPNYNKEFYRKYVKIGDHNQTKGFLESYYRRLFNSYKPLRFDLENDSEEKIFQGISEFFNSDEFKKLEAISYIERLESPRFAFNIPEDIKYYDDHCIIDMEHIGSYEKPLSFCDKGEYGIALYIYSFYIGKKNTPLIIEGKARCNITQDRNTFTRERGLFGGSKTKVEVIKFDCEISKKINRIIDYINTDFSHLALNYRKTWAGEIKPLSTLRNSSKFKLPVEVSEKTIGRWSVFQHSSSYKGNSEPNSEKDAHLKIEEEELIYELDDKNEYRITFEDGRKGKYFYSKEDLEWCYVDFPFGPRCYDSKEKMLYNLWLKSLK